MPFQNLGPQGKTLVYQGDHPRVRASEAGEGEGQLPAPTPKATTVGCDWQSQAGRRGCEEKEGQGRSVELFKDPSW